MISPCGRPNFLEAETPWAYYVLLCENQPRVWSCRGNKQKELSADESQITMLGLLLEVVIHNQGGNNREISSHPIGWV